MTSTEMIDRIHDVIEGLDNSDALYLWNAYCEATNNYDNRLECMDELPDLFDLSDRDSVFNLLNRFYFGHDENEEHSSANPNRNYFYFNGYGNIVTTDYPSDVIDVDELTDWIISREDSLDNDEIQEILDEYLDAQDEEEEEEEEEA